MESFLYKGNGEIDVFRTTNMEQVDKITKGSLVYCHNLAITPDGHYLYVSNIDSISIIDTQTFTIQTPIHTGGFITDITISATGEYIYASNDELNVVNVVETSTNRIIKTISGMESAFGVAITPNGQSLYVLTQDSITVVDLKTDSVIATIDTGTSSYGYYTTPLRITFTPSGDYAYVTFSDDSVLVVDTESYTIKQTINMGPHSEPFGLSMVSLETGNYVYVANNLANTVSVINTQTNIITTTVNVDVNPLFLINHGDYVYVSHGLYGLNSGKSVSVIDTKTNQVIKSIQTSQGTFGLARAPSKNELYVACSTACAVDLINTETNTVSKTIINGLAGGDASNGFALTTDQKLLYAINGDANAISVINTESNNVISSITIDLGIYPCQMAIPAVGKLAYVTNYKGISVIDLTTNTVKETITKNIGTDPQAIAITPDSLYAYVVNASNTYISIIEIATNTATTWTVFDKNPGYNRIAITPDGRYAYIGSFDLNEIVVLSLPNNKVVATIPMNQPSGIAASHTNVYVSNYNYINSISVIDVASQTISATIPLPSPYMNPTTIALSEEERRAYVSCNESIVVIDLDQNNIVETIPNSSGVNLACPCGMTIVKNRFQR